MEKGLDMDKVIAQSKGGSNQFAAFLKKRETLRVEKAMRKAGITKRATLLRNLLMEFCKYMEAQDEQRD